jgi:hypothetical protein
MAIGHSIAITHMQMRRMVAGGAVSVEIVTPHLLLRGASGIDRIGNE